ncbi:MAG: hypothetical protein ACRDT4_07295 [Micromonosporaceae bacterium]
MTSTRTRYAPLNATVRRWPIRAGTGVWEEPKWRLLTVDTPPTAFVVIVRSHHHHADTARPTAEGSYWCGPPAPDRTVAWLQRTDPVTRCWTVPGGVAVFDTAWDATVAWARHLAVVRRRGHPVAGWVQFLPLIAIPDLGTVPPAARLGTGGAHATPGALRMLTELSA